MRIGGIIRKVFDDRGMKVSAFAERIAVTRQSVYKLFQKESIDTELLRRIGEVLGYDFFRHYHLDPDSGKMLFLENPDESFRDPDHRYQELLLRYESTRQRVQVLEDRLHDKERLIGLLQAGNGKNRD